MGISLGSCFTFVGTGSVELAVFLPFEVEDNPSSRISAFIFLIMARTWAPIGKVP